MKLTKIALAVAATLVAGQAFAAPVTQLEITTARGNGSLQETWLSGASAPTYNVFVGVASTCDANTVSVFNAGTATTAQKPGSSSAGNFLAYACKVGGVTTVVYHTIDGGSFNAYAPHIPNDVDGDGNVGVTNLARIKNLNAASNATCASTTGTLVLPGQAAIPVFSKCATVVPATAPDAATAKPAGGFSDVEAGLFGVSTTGFGTEGDANVGQVFGVAVSTNLYRAMQVSQGIYASVAAANTADSTFAPANAPNMTSAQYTSLATGTYAADWAPIVTGSTEEIRVARRVSTSGTQASSNAFFLQNPCNGDPAIAGKLSPSKVSDTTPTFIVTEGSSTGNVKTALTNANTNGDFAAGVVSLENNWRTDTSNNQYRFVKLDNVHPEAPIAGSSATFDTNARHTAAMGAYPFHMELKYFVADTADSYGASLIPAVAASFSAAACADVPRGLTLSPLSGSSCAVGEVVAKGSRFGNNCQAQQLLF